MSNAKSFRAALSTYMTGVMAFAIPCWVAAAWCALTALGY
jgi:hypothetical protein